MILGGAARLPCDDLALDWLPSAEANQLIRVVVGTAFYMLVGGRVLFTHQVATKKYTWLLLENILHVCLLCFSG